MPQPNLETVRQVKHRYEAEIMAKKYVVGVGIGYADRKGTQSEELSLVVFVTKKISSRLLAPEDRIPKCLDGVPTDVQEVGTIKAL